MKLMAKRNVFLCDVELPEIVQEKADEAFSVIITEGKKRMKTDKRLENVAKTNEQRKSAQVRVSRTVKAVMAGVAAIAACIIVIVGKDALTGGENKIDRDTDVVSDTGVTEDSDGTILSDAGVTESSDGTILSALDNMFTLRVKAAEGLPGGQGSQAGEGQQDAQSGEQYVALEAGCQIPLVTGNKAQNYVLGGDGETGQVNYCINIPFSCEGDNIEKIAYSINKGAFQIVQAEGESIIVDGEAYVEDDRISNMTCGSIGGNYKDDELGLPEKPMETKFYKSFTLNYQKQSDDDTWINIVDNVPDSKEAFDLIWGRDDLESFNSGLQKLLDNTVITCTVWYTDNTSQSVDIKVGSRIMTYREAGEPEASVKGDPDEETVYITFELQK